VETDFGRPKEIERKYNSLPEDTKNRIEDFFDDLRINSVGRERTLKNYKFRLTKFFHQKNKILSEITSKDVDAYLKREVKYGSWGKPLSRASIKALHSCFNSFFIQQKRPDLTHKPKVNRSLSGHDDLQILTIEQRDAFFEKSEKELGIKWRAIFEFSYWEGLRISEMIEMKPENIDFVSNKVFIVEGKGGESHHIPLLKKAKEIIEKYMKSNEFTEGQKYLFEYEYKKGKNAGKMGKLYILEVEKRMREVLKELKMDTSLSFHVLRHSIASHLLEVGYTLPMVRSHLRHAKGSPITLRYLHYNETERKKVSLKGIGG
jgi:integrase/recombinase XerD